MAHIEWMHLCELAYFDRQSRLCMVGMTTHLVLPSLPVRMRQIMMVARVSGEHILVTLRDVPFKEEGARRFGIQLGPQQSRPLTYRWWS